MTPERSDDLKRLNLTTCGPGMFADRVLVIARADREISGALKNRLDEGNVEWAATDEQGTMLGVRPLLAVTATRSLKLMTNWLASVPAQWTRMIPLPTRDSQVLREGGGPFDVIERVVEVGDNRLFSLLSEPVGPSHGPLILMVSVANEDHTGPSRTWVELSRRWSSHGLRCVRFDLRGTGESPWLDHGKSFVYENEWLTDVTSVASFYGADDPSNAVYIGLSSGVYLAVESAIKFGARGLCAINPPIAMDSLQLVFKLRASTNRIARSLGNRLLWVMLYRPWPFAGLWQVGRVALPRTVSRDLLATAVDSGTELLVLASSADLSPKPHIPILRSIDGRRIQTPKNYRAVFVPGLDHSMHAVEGRQRAIALLDQFIMERMGGIASPHDQ
jgi:pimeloyl-ACP methyl ester carboxylesterase